MVLIREEARELGFLIRAVSTVWVGRRFPLDQELLLRLAIKWQYLPSTFFELVALVTSKSSELISARVSI